MRLAKFVKFREEKFGGVLFETRSEKVFTLNAIGAAVVREINAGCEEPEIVTRLKQNFQGDGARIEQEARAFIGELRSKGLVQD